MSIHKQFEKLRKQYDFYKFSAKEAELFEILSKIKHYMKKAKWYLVPFYIQAFLTVKFIAKNEARHALKK